MARQRPGSRYANAHLPNAILADDYTIREVFETLEMVLEAIDFELCSIHVKE